jgi:hypothetical protein
MMTLTGDCRPSVFTSMNSTYSYRIDTVSLAPPTPFQRLFNWYSSVFTFSGPMIQGNNFSDVKDTAEIYIIHLTDCESVPSFKGKIQQKYLIGNYPHSVSTLCKEVGGLPRPHFRFLRCHWHRGNRICRLPKQISRRLRSQVRNVFSPFIILC